MSIYAKLLEEVKNNKINYEKVEKYKNIFQLIRLRKDQTVAYYDFEMLKVIAEKRKEAFEEIWEIRG